MNLQKLLRPLRGDLMELLCKLIRTNTVAIPPDGAETPGQMVLRAFLRGYGISPELYEVAPTTEARARLNHKNRNYAGRKEPGRPPRRVGARKKFTFEWSHGHSSGGKGPVGGLTLVWRIAEGPHLRTWQLR